MKLLSVIILLRVILINLNPGRCALAGIFGGMYLLMRVVSYVDGVFAVRGPQWTVYYIMPGQRLFPWLGIGLIPTSPVG